MYNSSINDCKINFRIGQNANVKSNNNDIEIIPSTLNISNQQLTIGNGIKRAIDNNSINLNFTNQSPRKFLLKCINAEASEFWICTSKNEKFMEQFIKNVGFYIYLSRIESYAQSANNVNYLEKSQQFITDYFKDSSTKIECRIKNISIQAQLGIINLVIAGFVEKFLKETNQSSHNLDELLYIESLQDRGKKGQIGLSREATQQWDKNALNLLYKNQKISQEEYNSFKDLIVDEKKTQLAMIKKNHKLTDLKQNQVLDNETLEASLSFWRKISFCLIAIVFGLIYYILKAKR